MGAWRRAPGARRLCLCEVGVSEREGKRGCSEGVQLWAPRARGRVRGLSSAPEGSQGGGVGGK